MFTKKIIALMVLATMLVSGAALAGDGFKVYGKLHVSIDYMNDSQDSQIMMSNNNSRFGLKGSKELESNLTFIWQFESEINLAQKGEDTLVTRNSFLGLTGDWGTFLYGIHDTPFRTIGRKASFFYDELGDFRQMTMGWDRRLQDVVVYASPDMSGFGVVLGYQLDQSPIGAQEAKTAFSGSAAYKKDALFVGVAYEMLSKGNSLTYDDTENNVVYADASTGIRATAKYDFGTFALAGLFQTLSTQVLGIDSDFAPMFFDNTATTFGLEGKYTINEKYAVKASYYMANPNTDAEDLDGTDLDESAVDYSMLAMGVDRRLGKKTYMYVQFAMVTNGDNSMQGLGGPDHSSSIGAPIDSDGSPIPGQSPTGFSWGMVTKF